MVDLPTVGRFVGGAGYAPATETSLRALALQLPFCFEVRTLSDRLVSSAPE
jgi:hypothetical protein